MWVNWYVRFGWVLWLVVWYSKIVVFDGWWMCELFFFLVWVLVYMFVGIECGGCEKNDEYYGECVIVDGVFVCVVGMCDDFYFGVVCFYVFLEFVEGGF